MRLKFDKAYIQGLGIALPEKTISSSEIESRLRPTYERLNLVDGRLEAMTGINTRRHFPKGMRPSEIATEAANDLFKKDQNLKKDVDCLIYSSVCRNFVEPATASVVHHQLGLSPECMIWDLSNACLSLVNAVAMGASLIESGQAKRVLVVSGEDAREVVNNTIDQLNANLTLTRNQIKQSIATLTLGSGGSAVLLGNANLSGAKLLGAAFKTASEHHNLCIGGAPSNQAIQMDTQSEKMLQEGVKLAAQTWQELLLHLSWNPLSPQHYIMHQVGSAHRNLLIQRLELDPARDYSTFDSLGNMGASSIGVTLTRAAREKRFLPKDKIALMGIGSGLVCGMLALEWSENTVI